MGSCITAGGREWNDTGRKVDTRILEGQLLVLVTGFELMVRRTRRC
jgi:hypothetical protein